MRAPFPNATPSGTLSPSQPVRPPCGTRHAGNAPFPRAALARPSGAHHRGGFFLRFRWRHIIGYLALLIGWWLLAYSGLTQWGV